MTFVRVATSVIPLAVALAVGAVGASLFRDSLPGREGSAEERANKLEIELKRAQNRVAALEAVEGQSPTPHGLLARIAGGAHRDRDNHALADAARKVAEDIRAGRPVNPDDIFRACQPLLRDLAPLFDRMRVKQQRQMTDSLTGELARKYDLSPQNQELVKQWFERKSEEEAKRWSEMISRDGTRLEDVMRASQNVRPDEGLDAFMQGLLPPEKLTAFNSERTTERAQRVQREADMMVERVDGVVGLDENQRDQIFGVVARGSHDYDPGMAVEGVNGEIAAIPSADRQETLLAILRPEQRAAYEAEQQRRRDAAAKEAEAIGLTLPPGWDMLDNGFRWE